MSQESHTIFKELSKVRGIYYKCRRSGPGGIREDVYKSMMAKFKYDYLRKELEYKTVCKRNKLQEHIWNTSSKVFLSDEDEFMIEDKLNNDTELIQLNRTVKILKLHLLKKGYNKIHL